MSQERYTGIVVLLLAVHTPYIRRRQSGAMRMQVTSKSPTRSSKVFPAATAQFHIFPFSSKQGCRSSGASTPNKNISCWLMAIMSVPRISALPVILSPIPSFPADGIANVIAASAKLAKIVIRCTIMLTHYAYQNWFG